MMNPTLEKLFYLRSLDWPASRHSYLKSLYDYYLNNSHFTEAQILRVQEISNEADIVHGRRSFLPL